MSDVGGAIKIGARPGQGMIASSNLGRGVGEWVAYMDESGRDEESDYFVLLCVVGNAATMTRLDDEVRGIKRGLVPELNPNTWELHGKEIKHGPDRKRSNTPLWPRTKAKKIAVLNTVVNAVCDCDVTIFSVIIKKEKLRKVHGKDAKIIEYAMTFLLERIELFLRAQGKIGTVNLVSDSMRTGDRQMVERIVSSLARGRSALSCTKTEHIAGVKFVDSKSSNHVQAVDVMTYAINRHMRGDEDFGGMFARIESKIWKEGKWHGLRVY